METSQVEDFSRFAMLPVELLEKTCKEMDYQTLVKFTSTYSRAYQVCSKVYERKQKEELSRRSVRKTSVINEVISGFPEDWRIEDLCKSLPDQELLKYAKANQRVAIICEDIIRSRNLYY